MEVTIYKCDLCGRVVEVIKDSQSKLVCCGQDMRKLEPNTTDAAFEKHVPDVKVEGKTVTLQVGSTAHPMMEEHYIEWISIATKEGYQRKELKPGDAPVAVFTLSDTDEYESALAYCNLHGLWKA